MRAAFLLYFLAASAVYAFDSPKNVPIKFVDLSKTEGSFYHAQVYVGNATIPLWNGKMTPQKYQARLTPF